MDDAGPPTTRRNLLAGASVAAASGLAGCLEQLWSQAETTGPDQVSLTIKTVPADDDRLAATIASRLRENYEVAGIDATHEPIGEAELYRDLLLEGNYDVFVARHPGLDEPDAFHGLLHSRFVGEQGWQNPFQLADLTIDDALEVQRRADGDRADALDELLDHLLMTTPYTAVAHPHALGGRRDEIDVPSPPERPHEFLDVLSLPDNGPRDGPLVVGVYGEGLTRRLNPITVDQNRIDGLLGLLYDPLARRIDGEYVPWLIDDFEWDENDPLRLRITLRDGLEWHDGESLDAEDVEFTYRFVEDTSLGAVDDGIPAPRFRGRRTLVDAATVVDSRTITLTFTETTPAVARRALTIPILPEHVWTDRSTLLVDRQPEALAHDNDEPVGSGLLEFGEATTDVELELTPVEDHALLSAADRPDVLEAFPRYDGIRFEVAPNPGAMVDALIDGEIDITAGGLPPEYAESIRDADDVSTATGTTDAFYMIGYNAQHSELGHPHVRRICSQLIDREHVVTEFFEGFADPATAPTELVGLRRANWPGDTLDDERASTLLDFPGTAGEVDPRAARSLFREIHYSYEDDALLGSSG
ncbi:ABC transporter substrate-binding protein [Natronolimnohabitans innermongolicus]|uniref:Family 5 extracellular solute-binding protein n=1 Tax=Natronolimnohabitans innermongolicus JCM 12255 TaxID=1227499 RepID=L9XLA2_9EURY|nr:ABC transporter substrate-binding protein [Natronolimnohabitans innermongolicus]ELY62181.1 family 5 extracellular solute-binding protein [Natronolimnohabitans innermongolicus JCM 12255]